MKPGAPKADAEIFSRKEGGSSLVIGANAGAPYVEINGQRGAGKDALAPGQWAHCALVCDGAKTTLYVNGELLGGCDIALEMYRSGELKQLLDEVGATAA